MSRSIVEGTDFKGEKLFYHGIKVVGKSKKDLLPGDSFVRSDGKRETVKKRRLMVPGAAGLIDAPEGVNESGCFIVIESIVEEA